MLDLLMMEANALAFCAILARKGGKMKLQKIRVYLNAEFMDLLDYFASFYGTTNSEVLRFSLRSKDGFYKKPKRAQSVFFKQKRAKKDF